MSNMYDKRKKQPIFLMRHLFTLLFCILLCQCVAQEKSNPIEQLKTNIQSKKYPRIEGILVEKKGNIILEEYFGEFDQDKLHDTRSAFKSILSLLTGIAIDQGLINLEDKLLSYFPEYNIKDENDQKKARITLKDLITMKSGLNCEEFYGMGPDCETPMSESEDWIAFSLNIEMKDEPGVNWSYTSIAPLLLGEVIARSSKMAIMDFAAKYLFEPLGITDYRWTITPKGRGMTAGSFFMQPQDMLKIGQLVKNNGQWDGKQILSKAWLASSTTCDIDIDFSFLKFSRIYNAKHQSATYGYYWYREVIAFGDINTEVLFASGNGGQYIMILADYDAIIVFTGANYNSWRGKLPFEILLKYLIPIINQA